MLPSVASLRATEPNNMMSVTASSLQTIIMEAVLAAILPTLVLSEATPSETTSLLKAHELKTSIRKDPSNTDATTTKITWN